MKDEFDIVARTGVVRRPGHTYYIIGCDVWEQEVASDSERVKVASGNFRREPGHAYFLDANGDIVAVPIPTVSLDENDEVARTRSKRFFAKIDRLLRPRDDK